MNMSQCITQAKKLFKGYSGVSRQVSNLEGNEPSVNYYMYFDMKSAAAFCISSNTDWVDLLQMAQKDERVVKWPM